MDASPQPGPCASPGNPVFSCMLKGATLTTAHKAQLLLYRTTSGDYGAVPLTAPLAPCRYHPRDNAFTDHLLACGKAHYSGINTSLDKSRVDDNTDIINLS
ncbi:piercer of microtubule wall 2 protein [Heteronotia binoei]|uniref:piercer of microtubule wall 2 protein n=1 Tax=Heteronotia binoei TaxID=13085 RepID=UPI00292CCAF6|nr:piercer of microtubule wall 2 protein [Heteronotia binoei]